MKIERGALLFCHDLSLVNRPPPRAEHHDRVRVDAAVAVGLVGFVPHLDDLDDVVVGEVHARLGRAPFQQQNQVRNAHHNTAPSGIRPPLP